MREVFSATIGTGLIDLALGLYYSLQQEKVFEPSFVKKPGDLFKAFKATTDAPFERSIVGVKEYIESLPAKAYEYVTLVNESLLLALSDPDPISEFLQIELPRLEYANKKASRSFFKKGNLNDRILEIGAIQLAAGKIVHGHITNSLSRNQSLSQEQKLTAVKGNMEREFTFQFVDSYSDIEAFSKFELSSNSLYVLTANLLAEKFETEANFNRA